MTRRDAPITPAPLDPPLTAAELAWWRPRQRWLLLWSYTGSALWIVVGAVTMATLRGGLRSMLAKPGLTLGIFAAIGIAYTLVTLPFARKSRRATLLAKMTAAVRKRRMHDALIAPPSE